MFDPTDIMDRDLYFKTPAFNKTFEGYISTYGKSCTFYINPNHEASENDQFNNVDNSTEQNQKDVNDSLQRIDNYTLAYGKDLVGYDFAKLQKVNARLLAEYKDFYIQNMGAEESVSFMLHVKGTPVSRGDIISYKIQDKEVFYRISDKIQEFQNVLYRIQCKLIQVKELGGGRRPYDVHNHKADYSILPDGGIVL